MKTLLLLFLLPLMMHAQNQNEDKLTIEASSTVYVIADIVYFSINLRVDNPDPQIAFDEHQKLEANLLKLFNDYSIPDSLVQYSLLNISRTHSRSEEDKFFTSQQVKIKFTDVSKYHSFQIQLLKSGFYEFRAGFGSSEVKKARIEGYKAAFANAKRDAEIIANTLDKKLGKIIDISSRTNEFRQLDHSNAQISASVHSLIEIEQTVAARTKLKITYSLL